MDQQTTEHLFRMAAERVAYWDNHPADWWAIHVARFAALAIQSNAEGDEDDAVYYAAITAMCAYRLKKEDTDADTS